MRRILANFTAAAMLCMVLPSPALAFLLNEAHACCLRSNKHGCATKPAHNSVQRIKQVCPHTATPLGQFTPAIEAPPHHVIDLASQRLQASSSAQDARLSSGARPSERAPPSPVLSLAFA